MESLRNFLTGPRLIIVILVCALPFIFLGTSSIGSVFGVSFGTINGEDVSEMDMQIASNSAVLRFKSVYGDEFDFDMLDEEFQMESIKQELIVQKVLQSGAKSMGFYNDNTVDRAKKGIIQNPQFQIEGIFDEDVFEAQVNSNGYTKDVYIDLMASLIASELYRSSLSLFNFVTEYELVELATLLEKKSNIKFTKISFEGLKNELVNTSEELIEYYKNNEILFFSQEERSFKYIVLDQSDYKDKVEIPEGYIENAYDNYILNFENTSQTRISHIMIDKNNYDSLDLALEAIQEVETLLADGGNFFDIASEYSEDLVTEDIGGDLEYFEKDIFPVEFEEAIKDLNLNEITDIVELEDTFHILKVTEINIQEPLPEEQIKSELTNELIETESLALMNDDFDLLQEMILDGDSIEAISNNLSIEVSTTDLYTETNYNFYINNSEIKDYLFSVDSNLDEPYTIELNDKVILLSINSISEPFLMPYEKVAEDVAYLLSQSKAEEKIFFMEDELKSIESSDDILTFINSYNYVTQDEFVDVKRYSSLLPQEVLNEIFKSMPGLTISVDAANGDKYIVEIIKFDQPTESEINEAIEQYDSFGQDRFASKMTEIINEDAFQSARVNLKDNVF
tara:strand:- start:4542 stop:6413 length:1872 start_codon:yes stop_codon:yes gene_type:complete